MRAYSLRVRVSQSFRTSEQVSSQYRLVAKLLETKRIDLRSNAAQGHRLETREIIVTISKARKKPELKFPRIFFFYKFYLACKQILINQQYNLKRNFWDVDKIAVV